MGIQLNNAQVSSKIIIDLFWKYQMCQNAIISYYFHDAGVWSS